ncbi:MAG TPA: ABC transporter ATP-binding protein [Solirubrobacteraceae bacterium]|nr:ABC transporter ATP-binding protein [Solirubrobacteraceae bacterium]
MVTRGLTKRFGERVAVNDVHLEVPAGSAFGFLGPNGAGKTTMIRMLLGLTSISSGSASLLGQPIPRARAKALSRVGAIVEEPSFRKHLSGRENLEIVAAVRGPEAYPRIAPALERVGLAERADDRVSRYSLGMRQRLGVARCLLADPKLLILDEPTNGLDPHGIQEFRTMVRALVQDEGRTVFLSSHLLDEVERVCDHVAIVDHGRVIVQGSIEELTGRAGQQVIVGVDAPDLAIMTLEELPAVREVLPVDGVLKVRLDGRPDAVSELAAALVYAGVAVSRLEPTRHSLEERFLEITSLQQEVAA